MCGIGGIISLTPLSGERQTKAKEFTKELLNNLERRGTDASGIATVTFTNKYDFCVIKEDVTGHKLATHIDPAFKLRNINVVLVHTRATTSGSEKHNVNNHPHLNKETGSLLIHNGIITNDEKLTKEFNLKLDGKCDSEVILKLIDKIGLKDTAKKLEGSYAIGYTKGMTMNVFRGNGSPLYIAYIPQYEFYVFASDEDYLPTIKDTTPHKLGSLELTQSDKGYYGLSLDEGTLITFDFETKSVSTKEVKLNSNSSGVYVWKQDELNGDNDLDDDELQAEIDGTLSPYMKTKKDRFSYKNGGGYYGYGNY